MEEYKFFRQPSQEQIELLVSFMESHPKLASGQYAECYSLHKRERTWENLKNKLNSVDSPFKTRNQWKKVWNDKKCSVRNKAIMYKRRIQKNPEENNPKFTLIEKRIMKLIGFRQLSEVCPTINSNSRHLNTKKTKDELKNSGPKISFTESLRLSMNKCRLKDPMEIDSEQPITNGTSVTKCITSDVQILGNSSLSLSAEPLKTKESTLHENTLGNQITIKQEPSDDFLYETSSSSVSEIVKPIIVSVAPVLTTERIEPHSSVVGPHASTENSLSHNMTNASLTKSQSHVVELDPHDLITSTKELQLEDCTEDDINLLLNDYIKAKKKENLAQEASNLISDSSDFEKNTAFKRVRQKPLRYRDSSSDEDIFIVSEETGPKSKRKKYIISTPASSIKNSTEVAETRDFLSTSAISDSKISKGVEALSEDEAPLRYMISRVLYSLEEIKKDIEVIKKTQSDMNSQINLIKMVLDNEPVDSKNIYHLPEDVQLPVPSEDALIKLNDKLSEDKSFAPILVKYLSNVAYGKTLSAFTSNLLRKIFVKDVACLYSRLGRKGKKSFENYKDLFNAIMAVMSIKFPNEKKEDMAEKFGKVLAQASDWDGARRQKTNVNYCFY